MCKLQYQDSVHKYYLANEKVYKTSSDNRSTSKVANISPTHFRGPPPNGK